MILPCFRLHQLHRLPNYTLGIILFLACNLHAEELEEITVVADFRGQGTSQTASAITVMGESLIRQGSAQHLDDILGFVPNLNFAGGTSRARFFQIRGVGERSQFGEPLNPSVGYIVDNVDFSGSGAIGTLLDVQQIEVFRGPQGTRYGANALAGLIYVKTNDPTPVQTLTLDAGVANYNQRTISLVFNQPINDRVSTRMAIQQHSADGYYKNAFLGKDNTNGRDEITLRGKLKVIASDNWELNFGVSKTNLNNGYDTFSLDNNRKTLSDQPGSDNQDSTSLFLDSYWQGERFDLQVITGFANSDLTYSYDEDWTYSGFHPFGYTSFDSYQRQKQTLSLEARMISNDSGRIFDETTEWIVGLYSLTSEENLLRQYTFLGSDFTSEYDFDTLALFAQFDTSFSDKWALSMGGRIENRKTDYSNSNNFSVSPSENLKGGRLALKYFFSNNQTMAYASIARGYKAGGFNTDGTLSPNLREFDSESLVELEFGLKHRVQENLQLGLAIFHDKRRDQQVRSSFVLPRPDGSTEFIDFLGNAARGTNSGLEAEFTLRPVGYFSINGSLALLDAQFDKFVNEFGQDLSGRDQSQAPAYSYQFGLSWQNGSWLANLGVQGKDTFYFSDRHDLKSTKLRLVNANITYKADVYSINLWTRNLLNKDYTVRGFGSFGNDPRKGYLTEPYVQYGEPMVIGVTFSYDTQK